MINEKCAKKYCCDDLSLIENYELAINDTTQTWDCHHRRESIYSAKDLIEIGEYWKRSAAELIFLTPSEHHRLHTKGVQLSEDHKKAIGEAHKGVQLSEDHKKAISDAKKGVPIAPMSDAHKKAIGEAMKGVNAKKVLQFTKSGEFIKEWTSMSEAERELGIAHSSISGCCNGKIKSSGGYVWEYA